MKEIHLIRKDLEIDTNTTKIILPKVQLVLSHKILVLIFPIKVWVTLWEIFFWWDIQHVTPTTPLNSTEIISHFYNNTLLACKWLKYKTDYMLNPVNNSISPNMCCKWYKTWILFLGAKQKIIQEKPKKLTEKQHLIIPKG